MSTPINTDADYQQVKASVESLLQKATAGGGFDSLSDVDDQELFRLSHLMKTWEEEHYPMPTQPYTLAGMIELKMVEQKLQQSDVARLLHVETSRVSDLLQGKHRLSLALARRLYKNLGIPADFILDHA